ncbi:MAG: response regulator transcription factor [Lachnospiraceae bacterium]|nr:response regulator transcription factor [Lachnospiraceae bacterium]
MRRILVVEDDASTNKVISEVMKSEGYEVYRAFDGEEALSLFFKHKMSLVLLDIMMPKKSGLEVLKEIRENSSTPVIMLTAMEDDYTQIKSFDMQADEYVTKPFSPIVLAKRVKALLKLADPVENKTVDIGGNTVDFSSYEVTREGEKVPFTTKELEVLKFLVENAGRALSREQIIEGVWGFGFDAIDRTIDTHIKNIRKKLGEPCITTIKNVGYMFEKSAIGVKT